MLVLSATARAGEDDHLEPCQPFLSEYEIRVDSIALAAMPGKVELWVTMLVSFQPESIVGISIDKGRYFVTNVVFQQPLWNQGGFASGSTWSFDFSKPRVRTKAATARISPELHAALDSEWARSIESAHSVEKNEQSVKVDGYIFEFKSPGHCGSTNSPEEGTRNYKLVDLALALAWLADNKWNPLPTARRNVAQKLLRLSPP